MYVVMSWWCVA